MIINYHAKFFLIEYFTAKYLFKMLDTKVGNRFLATYLYLFNNTYQSIGMHSHTEKVELIE